MVTFAATTAACTPQMAMLAAAVPEGTASMLLSHTQRVADANRRRIAEYERTGDWAGLARFAEDNLQRDTHTPDWWLVAGYAYSQQRNHARAAECYREAVRLEPDVSLGWSLLAQSYRDAGQPERAARALGNALLARRDDPQLHWLLGESESDLRRWPAAIAAYRGALEVDPKFTPAWRSLARAYERAGRVEEAREARRTLERLTADRTGDGRARKNQSSRERNAVLEPRMNTDEHR